MSLDPAGEREWLAPPENARRMYQEAQNPQKALLIVLCAGHNTTYKAARSSMNLKWWDFSRRLFPEGHRPATARPASFLRARL